MAAMSSGAFMLQTRACQGAVIKGISKARHISKGFKEANAEMMVALQEDVDRLKTEVLKKNEEIQLLQDKLQATLTEYEALRLKNAELFLKVQTLETTSGYEANWAAAASDPKQGPGTEVTESDTSKTHSQNKEDPNRAETPKTESVLGICSRCGARSLMPTQISLVRKKADAATQTFETDFVYIDSSGSTTDWLVTEDSDMTVAKLVEETSKEVLQNDYVYDENTRLYYSTSTGWYYDPESRLFYDWKTQAYYTYDEASQTYQVYSPAATAQQEMASTVKHDRKSKKKKRHAEKMKKAEKQSRKRTKTSNKAKDKLAKMKEDDDVPSSLEEGELMSSSDDDDGETNDSSKSSGADDTEDASNEMAEYVTPCLRMIVIESSRLQEGSLLLVSCIGATVGREKERDLCIPDASVTKHHADITYDYEKKQYMICDLGSQNGTYINGERLSKSKQQSEVRGLAHGDQLALGLSRFLVHVHEGKETCNGCEPGLVQAELIQAKGGKPATYQYKTPEEREQERKLLMKQVKKKFGLQGSDFEVHKAAAISKKGYVDRAKERRVTKGIDTLYAKDEEPASVDKAISADNKGFKMMQKMGWTEGKGLGKEATGNVEPIPLQMRTSKAGLGSEHPLMETAPQSAQDKRKTERWAKAQQRYKEIEGSTDTLDNTNAQ